MSKTKTPTIKSTSVPSVYDTPLTTLEYLRKVEEQNAQVLTRQDEIEEALNDRVAKSGDTMTGALNTPQVNADTGVFRHLNAVSQNGNTHVEVANGGFIAEVTEENTSNNKKYGVIAYPNGKVGFYAHDALHNKDVNFIIPNMDDYEAGTYELTTKDKLAGYAKKPTALHIEVDEKDRENVTYVEYVNAYLLDETHIYIEGYFGITSIDANAYIVLKFDNEYFADYTDLATIPTPNGRVFFESESDEEERYTKLKVEFTNMHAIGESVCFTGVIFLGA